MSYYATIYNIKTFAAPQRGMRNDSPVPRPADVAQDCHCAAIFKNDQVLFIVYYIILFIM